MQFFLESNQFSERNRGKILNFWKWWNMRGISIIEHLPSLCLKLPLDLRIAIMQLLIGIHPSLSELLYGVVVWIHSFLFHTWHVSLASTKIDACNQNKWEREREIKTDSLAYTDDVVACLVSSSAAKKSQSEEGIIPRKKSWAKKQVWRSKKVHFLSVGLEATFIVGTYVLQFCFVQQLCFYFSAFSERLHQYEFGSCFLCRQNDIRGWDTKINIPCSN